MNKIAVIGDVHANALALKEVLRKISLKHYDTIIFLGDLLTYGTDVHEVIDLIDETKTKYKTILIQGNHDLLYDNYINGLEINSDKLEPWILESFEWTANRINYYAWKKQVFKYSYSTDGIFFSHANPFGVGNWNYLDNIQSYYKAAMFINDMGYNSGIFGHTHRSKYFQYNLNTTKGNFIKTRELTVSKPDVIRIINPGSIGQSRDKETKDIFFLSLTFDKTTTLWNINFDTIYYNVNEHIKKIINSGMSDQTKKKLISFFV